MICNEDRMSKTSPLHLLVLSRQDAPQLPMLRQLEPQAEITVGNSAAELKQAAENAEMLLVWEGKQAVLREIFPFCKNLRWIHSKNAGIEPLLFPALQSSNVTLTNSRGVYARSLAEFALMGILYFAKDLPRLLRQKQEKHWEQFEVEELAGKTVGIFGYGEIGRAVALKCKAFDMQVLGLRRNAAKSADDRIADEILPQEKFSELLTRSDILVIAAPHTAETHEVFGEREFRQMKPASLLVNIGRGSIIREPDLIQALRRGTIRGAVLDVFATEPLPPESELWTLPNALLSPHSADQTATWLIEAMDFFLANFKRYAAGEPLANVCDTSIGY
jgi:phosphoglycerate dehydrogenase-like enzyme